MTGPTVEIATTQEAAAVVALLTLAFARDPANRWTWPQARTYLEAFPRFVRAYGGAAFALGTAARIGEAAAALWLPPGASSDEPTIDALMEATAAGDARRDGPEAMRRMLCYRPREAHWYLPMIGVDPLHQGQGLGSALLRHATARCDRDGLPAFLESSNPRNVPLYQAHGFEVLGRIQVGGSPTFVPMLRRPRRQ